MSKLKREQLSKEELYKVYEDYFNEELNTQDIFNYDVSVETYTKIRPMLKKEKINYCTYLYNTFYNKKLNKNIIEIEDYDFLINILKRYCSIYGRPHDLELSQIYKLPSCRWFVKNTKNKKVKCYNDFVEYELGLVPCYMVSKEKASEIILEMQSKLDRPIMKKDFANTTNSKMISESVITRIWGSINKMKEDLGLKVVQENMLKYKSSIEKVKEDIKAICGYVYITENRKEINQHDFDNVRKLNKNISSYPTCQKYLIKNGSSIREYIESLGYTVSKMGMGMNYQYDDYEFTTSFYEKSFSDYLRNNLNLKYNTDYKRNIRYNTFIDDYDGLMDCDYVITIGDKTLYIELGCIIRDHAKEWETYDFSKSKTKSRYVEKLKLKKKMLEESNLDYYILFPYQCNEEYYNIIFNKYIE